MLNNKLRTDYLIISVLTVMTLIYLYVPFLGNDNTHTIYGDIIHDDSYWMGQYRNYRYVSALVGRIIYILNLQYYDFIYLWVLFFGLSIAYCCYEFIKFCKLPIGSTPFMIIAVASSGYMADLYAFSMVYMAYGFAYLGIALALRSIRCLSGVYGVIFGILFSLVTIMSYQVTLLILLYASSITLLSSVAADKKEPIAYILKPIFVFLITFLLFLAIKKLIGPSNGRSIVYSNISENIFNYIALTVKILTDGFGRINFKLEIYAQFIVILSSMYLVIRSLYKNLNIYNALAFSAFAASILTLANPVTMIQSSFFAAPRQLTAGIFFPISCAIIIYTKIPIRFKPVAFLISVFFITAALYNQIDYLVHMRGQDERDRLAVELITNDISKISSIDNTTKLAVVSSPANFFNDQWRFSAFNTNWSRTEIFRVLTGKFVKVAAPKMACEVPDKAPWTIKKIDDIIVVCLQ